MIKLSFNLMFYLTLIGCLVLSFIVNNWYGVVGWSIVLLGLSLAERRLFLRQARKR